MEAELDVDVSARRSDRGIPMPIQLLALSRTDHSHLTFGDLQVDNQFVSAKPEDRWGWGPDGSRNSRFVFTKMADTTSEDFGWAIQNKTGGTWNFHDNEEVVLIA